MKRLLLISLLWLGAVQASTLDTLESNGPSANRVDIVVLGDGYASGDLARFRGDVDNVVAEFFNEPPFDQYRRFFNVHRITVVSADSGIDHPENDDYKDTAFDSYYNCADIQRLICTDSGKVFAAVNAHLAADAQDIVLLVVNDDEYGGSGGSVAVTSRHPSAAEIALHELGHSFGLLADEYDTSPPECHNTVEPYQPNVTRETRRARIKWNTGGGPPSGWIDPATPLPTTDTVDGQPGLYEGARYCETGLYRPTHDSLMRSLGRPFEQVNEEQLVRRIYNFVSPLDSRKPTKTNLTLLPGERTLSVKVPNKTVQALKVKWFVNGAAAGKGRKFDTNGLAYGDHVVEAVITDPTSKVRHDPGGVLSARTRWNLTVVAPDSDGDGIPDNLDPDDDNDGIPDAYEETRAYLDPLDPTDAGLDEDGDGFSNLDEYLFGSDPADPDDYPSSGLDGLWYLLLE